jgi:hypothetical protein
VTITVIRSTLATAPDVDSVVKAIDEICVAPPRGRRPDALICTSGRLTLGVVRALRSSGVRVPDDLAAAAAAKTPFFFSTDITPAARPIAIDGSRELIQAGAHREAVFWIVATFARCHTILAADASPELQRALAPAFDAIVADLGITSTDDLIRRAEDVTQFLPRLWETTDAILSINPGISPQ